MQPSNDRRKTQLQLTFEADESQIWETLERSQQDQVTNYLAALWIEHVTQQLATPASTELSGNTSQFNRGNDSHE